MNSDKHMANQFHGCRRWNHGPYSGAFKRAMTYSYLLSVPLMMTYSLGFAIIKYIEGFVFIPGFGVVPKPFELWRDDARRAIFPLYLTFAVAWSLEMVTHLEELCFWLFLVNAGSARRDWFRSVYFRTWLVGSVIAICYMPLVTIFTRSDVLKCEAYTFLAGSLGSLSITICFLPILWTFPAFLRNLRSQGVEKETVTRLTKFHELNTLRVIFRFLFVAPLVILGIDGVRPHQHINESMIWTDLLAMISALGCVVSSGITLVIFFPRSIDGEIAAKEAARERHRRQVWRDSVPLAQLRRRGTYLLTASPVKHTIDLPSNDSFDGASPISPGKVWLDGHGRDSQSFGISALPMRSNSKSESGDMEMPVGVQILNMSEEDLSRHNSRMTMNHLVYKYTSPIELANIPYNPRSMSA